jgi:hypothetical protein
MAASATTLRGGRDPRLLQAARLLWRIADMASSGRTTVTPEARHPLAPAAVRVERSRAQGQRGNAEQTALTVWFGTGPDLPSPSVGARAGSLALRASAGLLAAAALGAMGVIASQREAQRLEGAAAVRRIAPHDAQG